MTTITIKNDPSFNFQKTEFDNSLELLEFLNSKFGIQTTWAVSDQDIPKNDLPAIQEIRESSWVNLDNI